MKLTQVFLALILLFNAVQAAAQCAPGQDVVRLEINTDRYFYEESWTFSNEDGTEIYGTGTVPDSATHFFTYCLPDNQCAKFTIMDEAGDGFFPDGYYRIYVNDTLVYSRLNGSFFGLR